MVELPYLQTVVLLWFNHGIFGRVGFRDRVRVVFRDRVRVIRNGETENGEVDRHCMDTNTARQRDQRGSYHKLCIFF